MTYFSFVLISGNHFTLSHLHKLTLYLLQADPRSLCLYKYDINEKILSANWGENISSQQHQQEVVAPLVTRNFRIILHHPTHQVLWWKRVDMQIFSYNPELNLTYQNVPSALGGFVNCVTMQYRHKYFLRIRTIWSKYCIRIFFTENVLYNY